MDLEFNPALSLMEKLGTEGTRDVNSNFPEEKMDELVRVAGMFVTQYGKNWTAFYNSLGVVFYPGTYGGQNIEFIVNVGIKSEVDNVSPGSYIDVFPRFGLTQYGGAVTAFVDDASDKMWERIAGGRTLLLDDLLAGVRLEEMTDKMHDALMRRPWPVVAIDIAGGDFIRVPDSDEGFDGLLDAIFHGLGGE